MHNRNKNRQQGDQSLLKTEQMKKTCKIRRHVTYMILLSGEYKWGIHLGDHQWKMMIKPVQIKITLPSTPLQTSVGSTTVKSTRIYKPLTITFNSSTHLCLFSQKPNPVLTLLIITYFCQAMGCKLYSVVIGESVLISAITFLAPFFLVLDQRFRSVLRPPLIREPVTKFLLPRKRYAHLEQPMKRLWWSSMHDFNIYNRNWLGSSKTNL